MKMRKIIAILAAVLMLCSILPISAMAAEDVTINTYAKTGTLSGTTSISWESGDYQVVSYKNTSSTAIRTSDADHFRYYVGNKLVISGKDGALMSKVVITCTGSSYMLNNASNTLDAGWTVSASGTTLTYTPAGGSASELTITIGKQSRSSKIVITPAAAAEPEEPSTCEHDWVDANCTTPKTCSKCGATEGEALGHDWEIISEEEATCTADGSTTYECAACGEDKVEATPALPHDYVDGVCSVCGAEEPNIAEYTITFDANKTQRTEFSTTKQVWKNGALTFTNNKANSSSAVADYGAPVRLYANSEIVVECVGMTQIVFDCNTEAYATTLKNSIGAAATVSGDKVTVAVSDNTLTATLSGQVRMDSITVTAEVEDAETCEHENAKACDAYCPDCGELISEGATHVSDAQYPCYAGACIHCGEAIAAVDHVLDENDICTVCGLAPTPENPVDPENPQEYVFKNFAAGTQYAENEKHFLDNAVTVITNQAHFTTELRIYSSSTNNGSVVIKSKKDISAIVLNAGNKKDVLNVYISEDGEIYEAIEITATTYNDYTLLIPEMTKYIKLDVAGDQQIRVAKMTLYFDGEMPHVCEFVGVETKAPTCTEAGEMTYSCTCGEGTYTEEIAALGHTYADDYDVNCDVCGEIRVTDYAVVTSFGGNSVSEDVSGLAFLFNVDAQVAIAFERITEIDYANSTIDGMNLVKMGAVLSNKGADTILDNLGDYVVDIPAVYAWNYTESSVSYAVRITEIPEGYGDRVITARPYVTYEADGVEITIYGEEQAASYNGILG